MAGILQITDGTTTIDLKTGIFRLVDWTPVTPPTKGGGVWQDSMLDDGRRLTMTKRGNGRETFQLRVAGQSMDDTILETQELRRLLEKARQYWTTNWQNEPVWIAARGACETNTRYAYVMDYLAERDDNPYISPFNGEVLATMDEWALEIERSDWLNNLPGDGSCVALASLQDYYTATAEDTAAPTQAADDASIEFYVGSIGLVTTTITMGHMPPAIYGGGIRFRGVAIPAGATIISARIDVQASAADAGTIISAVISGELNVAPAVFTTFANFIGRTLTTNKCNFSTSEAWVAGTTYTIAQGAGLVALLQEIVDLGGWAAGNNLAVLIYDNASGKVDMFGRRRFATWDNVTYTDEPILYVEWSTAASSRGRAATCNNEVYFANKHNTAQITNAYHHRAAAWVDIMGAALPSALFSAIPAAGDILYMGVDTTIANSGPFSNVIFDIGTAANDIIAVDWEYWNGGWAALTTVRTIDTVIPVEYFNVPGVGSVSFVQPADWATTAVNGITGYWIRCVIAVVGAVPGAPTQANRRLYTVVRPSVDIDELQVIGDVSALARIKVHDYTDIYHASSVILATRSQSRGANFRMYLNVSDEQNIPGISSHGPVGFYVANTSSPTGRCGYYNPGAGSTGWFWFRIESSIAYEYFGRYRAYLRVHRNDAGATDCTVKLSVGIADQFSLYTAYTYISEIKTILSNQPNYLIDFGTIDIPGFGALRSNDVISPIDLRLDFANGVATPELNIYDLILVPVDEWAGEFSALNPDETPEKIGFMLSTTSYRMETYLEVDSLNLKNRISAYTRNGAGNIYALGVPSDLLQFSWKNITAAAAQLQANKDQQVFAMLKTYYATNDVWLLPVEGLGTLDIDAAARYLSMRGDR